MSLWAEIEQLGNDAQNADRWKEITRAYDELMQRYEVAQLQYTKQQQEGDDPAQGSEIAAMLSKMQTRLDAVKDLLKQIEVRDKRKACKQGEPPLIFDLALIRHKATYYNGKPLRKVKEEMTFLPRQQCVVLHYSDWTGAPPPANPIAFLEEKR
jgi:hypothetical protein